MDEQACVTCDQQKLCTCSIYITHPHSSHTHTHTHTSHFTPADRQQFIQDVTVLLMSTHTKQLLTIQLTRNYNEIFRGPATTGKLPPITAADMVETLKKIPGFSVS